MRMRRLCTSLHYRSYSLYTGSQEIVLAVNEDSVRIDAMPHTTAMATARSLSAASRCALKLPLIEARLRIFPFADIGPRRLPSLSSVAALIVDSNRTRPVAAKMALLRPSETVVGTV